MEGNFLFLRNLITPIIVATRIASNIITHNKKGTHRADISECWLGHTKTTIVDGIIIARKVSGIHNLKKFQLFFQPKRINITAIMVQINIGNHISSIFVIEFKKLLNAMKINFMF